MSLFDEPIDDDFDDFDDLEKEVKPSPGFPQLSGNPSKDVLPPPQRYASNENHRDPPRQSPYTGLPQISKPGNDSFAPKYSGAKGKLLHQASGLGQRGPRVKRRRLRLRGFLKRRRGRAGLSQNQTNKFATALDQKTKDFAQFNQNLKTLENALPSKKLSSRAGTGTVGDDDEPGESGNNFGEPKRLSPSKQQSATSQLLSGKLKISEKRVVKPPSPEEEEYGYDDFDVDSPQLPKEKFRMPVKPIETRKQPGRAPLVGNASVAAIPAKVEPQKRVSQRNKQFESAVALNPRESREQRIGRHSAASDSVPPPAPQNHISPGVRPKHVKIGKGNVFEVVEQAITKARSKLEKIESQNVDNIYDGQELYTQLDRQNKALRAELKSLNGNLNLILQQFDSFDFAKGRSSSQRPSSKKRIKTRSEQVKNNEKMLYNAQHEHERMTRRLEQVQDINYQIQLQKNISLTDQRIRETTRQIKHLQHSQRDREKKMDGMIMYDNHECVTKVTDMTNQLTVLYDKINRKQGDLVRTADVKTKMNEHYGQLKVANENITKIARHYGVDMSMVNPMITGLNHPAPENPQMERYKQLEKKLRLVENDFERVRLKNKINDMKKQKKALAAKRMQLQQELRQKSDLNNMSRDLLKELIDKFKNTGDKSTVEIVERWENRNQALLQAPTEPKEMVSNDDRKTPHTLRGGAAVPIRQSANGIKGPPPPLANLTVDQDMIQPDLSPIEPRVNQTMIEDPPSVKRDISKPSFMTKNKSQVGSKPFQIKKGSLATQQSQEKQPAQIPDPPSSDGVPEETNEVRESIQESIRREPTPPPKAPSVEPKEEAQPPPPPVGMSKPSFSKKPFGKPFGKPFKAKPLFDENGERGAAKAPDAPVMKKQEEEDIPFSQQFGIQQDTKTAAAADPLEGLGGGGYKPAAAAAKFNAAPEKPKSPQIKDPFAKFDDEDPFEKYGGALGGGRMPEKKADIQSARKTRDFLDKSGAGGVLGAGALGGGGAPVIAPRKQESRNMFQASQDKGMSDFDDIDFEEKEKEAGIRAPAPAVAASRGPGGGGGGGGGVEKSHGELDFDDLEF